MNYEGEGFIIHVLNEGRSRRVVIIDAGHAQRNKLEHVAIIHQKNEIHHLLRMRENPKKAQTGWFVRLSLEANPPPPMHSIGSNTAASAVRMSQA